MFRRIVECVPNFSEGRDPEVLREIANAIRAVPGILLLGEEQDPDHHRAVITFVGDPDAVLEAAVRAAGVAKDRIDLNRHQGAHPRIGALDVLPFIPVQNVTLADCAQLARRAAQQIWERCGIPCYLYEAAALREDRRNLADIRRGNFEGLSRDVAANEVRRPDVGGPLLHPSAGAVAVGARKFLIAWNVQLRTSNLNEAKEIATLVRQSSGGFPFVKALGLALPSKGITQVSMNLLDFEETPMQPVFDAIQKEAARRGIEVIGSELIGFLPRKALEVNVRQSLHFLNLHPDRVLEQRIDSLEQARFPAGRKLNGDQLTLRFAFQAVDLLQQAVTMATTAFQCVTSPAEGWSQGEDELHQLRQEAARTVAWMEVQHNPNQPNSLAEDRLLALAEQCVGLKSRLASGRQLFLANEENDVALHHFHTAWHLSEASIRLFLMFFGTERPEGDEPLDSISPSTEKAAQDRRRRIQAIRELTQNSRL